MSKELKIELFNIYDIVVFEDENGITQDFVYSIGKDKEADKIVDIIGCNNNIISIYENGSYTVWEKDGKDLPYYATNKKIIHLYTLKNDNRFYEVYPINDYEFIDNAYYSEALECLKNIEEIGKDCLDDCCAIWFNTIKQALLKAQELEKENTEYKDFRRKTEIVKRALQNGIYAKDLPNENKLKYIPSVALSNIETEWYLSNHCDFCVNVKGYKTLFWLKEDKSE